ncbi:MAG: insulinase family protein [Firmicutes bacterium]|nr:insulinase family protein [Bacillota bacterium]
MFERSEISMPIVDNTINWVRTLPASLIDGVSGVPAAVWNNPGSPTTSIMVSFKDGVAYEPENLWGISHFVEHILFRGTVNIPSLYEISDRLESMGGRISAYSTRDMTAFWVKILPGFEEEALYVLQELIANPGLKEEFIAREKEIIYQERQRELNNPTALGSNLIESLLLEPDPISRHPVGENSFIAEITPKTISNYMAETYHLDNIHISAAGNVTPKMGELTEKFLRAFKNGKKPERAEWKLNPPYDPENEIFILPGHHKTQVHLSVGWKFEKENEEELFAWRVLGSLLGSGYTSLFNAELRERQNITYVCTTGTNFYWKQGIFKLNLSLDIKNLEKALVKIEEVIDNIKNGGLTEELFRTAVMKHISGIVFRMEDSLEAAKILGHSLVRENRLFSFEDYFTGMRNTNPELVMKIAAKCLTADNRKILLQTGSEEIRSMFSQAVILEKN